MRSVYDKSKGKIAGITNDIKSPNLRTFNNDSCRTDNLFSLNLNLLKSCCFQNNKYGLFF